ncbi:hypothetical protein PRZ48_011800 [Zasmidium cellare]|uniref:S-adenosyl-L-methionine-dependent methyltransferase n=1 Tax=Zasmidium cellare TaxID=395010 RepID=A0ABR0E7F9_ZASCE|nr:hypothetical protein PRZ48_011800 [Zasmidium cellare]
MPTPSPPQRTEVPADSYIEPPTHQAVDIDNFEAETPSETSDYESTASSTASVSSSIFDYQYENGRRYHAFRAGQYLLPNDEAEQDRLDITHHIFRLCLQGDLCLTQPSLDDPKRILDVGTGTGIWAMEMGDLFPYAEIHGTDLSPVQPSWVPPNVKFEIDDARDEWTYPADYFDFIHIRQLAGSMLDWNDLISQSYHHLRPGGKLEISEGRANFWYAHDSVPSDSFTYQWLMEWRRLSSKVNFDVFPTLSSLVDNMEGSKRFQNVRTVEKLVPFGSWPKDRKLKEIGKYFKFQFLESGLDAYTLALFTRVGQWQELEIRALLARAEDIVQLLFL